MPADNFIVRHWKTEIRIFDQNVLLLKEQIGADPIHDLRVAIKKLRSYLKLHGTLFKGKDFKVEFEKTNQLFSIFGKHRNIEISKQLLPSFFGKNKSMPGSLVIYLELLQEQIKPYCQQTIYEYDPAALDTITNQLELDVQGLPAEDLISKVRDVIMSSIGNVKDNLKHFQKKSHLVRKLLKDIYYWLKVLPEGAVITKQETKMIDKILDNLGRIQDYEVFTTNLKGFRKIILSSGQEEYDLVKGIEAKAKKKKEGLLKKAHDLTDELLSNIDEGKRPQ